MGFLGNSSLEVQSKDAVRLMRNFKLAVGGNVFLSICQPCILAADLSRMCHTSHPVTAMTGSSTPMTLDRPRCWMLLIAKLQCHQFHLCSLFNIFYQKSKRSQLIYFSHNDACFPACLTTALPGVHVRSYAVWGNSIKNRYQLLSVIDVTLLFVMVITSYSNPTAFEQNDYRFEGDSHISL